MQQVHVFDSARFNGLPEIEKADAEARKSNELTLALSSLGPLFVKHGVHESWGLSLLHKHWSVGPDELPIQEVTRAGSPMEFESRPRTAFAKSFAPSVLAVNGDQRNLQPLEFSSDASVSDANEVLSSRPAFMREFASTVIDNKLEEKFGLIAIRETKPGYDFVEFNFVEPVSIVRETRPEEIEGQQVIETSWRFAPYHVGGTCARTCWSKCTLSDRTGTHQPNHLPVHVPS